MKNFKKQWKKELNNIVPSLSEEVKNAPIYTDNSVEMESKKTYKFSFRSLLASSLVAVLGFCFILPTILNAYKKEEFSTIMLEINPSVAFSVNERGKVVNVVSANADADVILSDKDRLLSLKGVSVNEASKKFVDYALELGFVDFNNNHLVNLSTSVKEEDKDLLKDIKSDIEVFLKEKGAYVAVKGEYLEERNFSSKFNYGNISYEKLNRRIRGEAPIFSVRNKTWKQNYKEIVNLDEKIENLKLNVLEVIEKTKSVLKDKTLDIAQIYSVSQQIQRHEEVPTVMGIPMSYWSIKNKKVEIQNQELNSLLTEMDLLIANYLDKHDKSIDSWWQLYLEKGSLDVLNLIFNNDIALITVESVCNNAQAFFELMFEVNGYQSDELKLFNTPSNEMDYKRQLVSYSNLLRKENENVYNEERQIITDLEYQTFLNQFNFN